MSPFFKEALALKYRPDLDVLFLRWPQLVYALSAKEVYQQVLELAKESNARYWLFDLRTRGPLPAEEVHWLKDTFYPQLHGKLGKVTHVAYLVTPSHAEHEETIQFAKVMRTMPWYGKGANFEGFTSESEALQWLKRCQLAEIVS